MQRFCVLTCLHRRFAQAAGARLDCKGWCNERMRLAQQRRRHCAPACRGTATNSYAHCTQCGSIKQRPMHACDTPTLPALNSVADHAHKHARRYGPQGRIPAGAHRYKRRRASHPRPFTNPAIGWLRGAWHAHAVLRFRGPCAHITVPSDADRYGSSAVSFWQVHCALVILPPTRTLQELTEANIRQLFKSYDEGEAAATAAAACRRPLLEPLPSGADKNGVLDIDEVTWLCEDLGPSGARSLPPPPARFTHPTSLPHARVCSSDARVHV